MGAAALRFKMCIMDSYLPGIIAVIEKDVSPVDAIAQIEGA
jgi:hypothetical protein